MDKKILNILMIDDHPSMIEGYKSILTFNDLGYGINVTPAYNCQSAYEIITKTEDLYAFDMAFIDLSLPPYEQEKIFSGQDLAMLIKKKFPVIKIMILTSHAEAFTLFDIKRNIEPKGLLVKSDFTADELLNAFESIMENEVYYTKTVEESINELMDNKNAIFLDEHNREIIQLLAKGVLTKNMPNYINLGISAIDKRKAQIKEYFLIKGGTDEDIVREAKNYGFI
ncbi:DNA-binding response regulator [Flavobacterium sediminis]|uniref:DNA-binding response regulator n=1 Tax=Flavobacterium sediminis TaxID=2201181 RepID=A0A2U8QUK5_9FLAO|nr:response regulator [Flavobacterium sediminis]AWM13556.1 DNA-binding response regulator [Flavobacterium sediminis]